MALLKQEMVTVWLFQIQKDAFIEIKEDSNSNGTSTAQYQCKSGINKIVALVPSNTFCANELIQTLSKCQFYLLC